MPPVDSMILPGFLVVSTACAVIDAKTFRIPDVLTGGFAVFALSVDFLGAGIDVERIFAASLAAAVLFLAGRLSGAGIGLGDIKLGAAGAFALGLKGGWIMLALASGLGVAVFWFIRRRFGTSGSTHPNGYRMPFAPFLTAGAFIATAFIIF